MSSETYITAPMLAVCLLLTVIITAMAATTITFCAMRPRVANQRWQVLRQNYNEKHDEKHNLLLPQKAIPLSPLPRSPLARIPDRIYTGDEEKGFTLLPPVNPRPTSPWVGLPASPRGFKDQSPMSGSLAPPRRPYTPAWTATNVSTISLPLEGNWDAPERDVAASQRFSFGEERPLTVRKGRSWRPVRLHKHKVSDGSFWG